MAFSDVGLAAQICRETQLGKTEVDKILYGLTSVARKQVKHAGRVRIPGLVNIRATHVKPATTECVKQMFGRLMVVKAKSEKTILKASCVESLKRSISCPDSFCRTMPVTEGGLAAQIALETKLQKKDITKILNSLTSVARKQVKDAGKFRVPGLVYIKRTRVKPATKACEQHLFGGTVLVKAKPQQIIVKASCVESLKRSVEEYDQHLHYDVHRLISHTR